MAPTTFLFMVCMRFLTFETISCRISNIPQILLCVASAAMVHGTPASFFGIAQTFSSPNAILTPAVAAINPIGVPPPAVAPIVATLPTSAPATSPTPYDITTDAGYVDCSITITPGTSNMNHIYTNGFAFMKCKENSKCYAKNQIKGQVYLERDAIWRGSSIVKAWARVIVGQRSDIGISSVFTHTVNIGDDCHFGSGGQYRDAFIGNMVSIGNDADVQGIIHNNVSIGDNFVLKPNSIINEHVVVGNNVSVGAGSIIKGNLGDKVCVGDDVQDVGVVPSNSYVNADRVIRPRSKGMDIDIQFGRCVEYATVD